MKDISWLECIRCGKQTPLLSERRFVCACGGLYDVMHDFSHLKHRGAQSLLMDFDGRSAPAWSDPRHNSGVWRFHELVMPSLDPSDIVTLGEGRFPMWRAGKNLSQWIGGELDLYLMPEGLNPTGSFKDMGGTVMMSVAKKAGIKAIACASTGDTSAMAAAYAAAAGIACVVVLPRGQVTSVQLAQPLAHGAIVVTIPGSFDDCMRAVKELVAEEKVFPANSLNPTRIEGHQATVFLAAQFFDWRLPDAFVVPIGNGSNASSVGKGIRTLRQLGLVKGGNGGRIIGVQSDAANPLAVSWEIARTEYDSDPAVGTWRKAYNPQNILGKTTATAMRIGDPVSREKVMREIVASKGAVICAAERELNEAVMVAGKDGYSICPQTGTALAGLRQAVERGFVKWGERAVVVSTATGLKFPEVPASFARENIIEANTCETREIADIIGV